MAASTDWIIFLLLGGVLGAVGQGLRVVVGLKKAKDDAAQKGLDFKDVFDAAQLVVSLIIGFIAGVLAMLAIDKPGEQIDRNVLLGVIVAGYAGTDFIEGFIQKYLPSSAAQDRSKPDVGAKPNQQDADAASTNPVYG